MCLSSGCFAGAAGSPARSGINLSLPTPVDGLQDLKHQQSVPHPLIGPQPLRQARLQQLFQGGGRRLLLLLLLAAAAGCCLAAAILLGSWHGCAGSWAGLRGLVLDPAGQTGSCEVLCHGRSQMRYMQMQASYLASDSDILHKSALSKEHGTIPARLQGLIFRFVLQQASHQAAGLQHGADGRPLPSAAHCKTAHLL